MPLYHRKLVDSNKIICRDNEHLMHLNTKFKRLKASRTETFISLDNKLTDRFNFESEGQDVSCEGKL
jgi:hypothetical protein